MFNLKESIDTWKRGFYKNESFTKDDIDELESHLVDMIYDLEERGFSKVDAFNKATETLGSSEALSNDFKMVNRQNILVRRFILCIIGFTFINFMVQLIGLITGLVIIPLESGLSKMQLLKIPFVYQLVKLMYGPYNPEIQIMLLVSIMFGIGTLYLILRSKRNLISMLIDKIDCIYTDKLIYKVTMSIIVLLISFAPYFIPIILNRNIGGEMYGKLIMGLDVFELIFRIILSIGFIYKLNKSQRNNDFLWSIGGYIFIVILRNTIPGIVMILTLLFGLSNPTIYGIIYIIIIGAVTYLTAFINWKANINFRNKFKNMLFGVVIILSNFIYVLLVPFVARYTTAETYGRVQYTSSLIGLALILIAQVTMNIMLSKRNKVRIV